MLQSSITSDSPHLPQSLHVTYKKSYQGNLKRSQKIFKTKILYISLQKFLILLIKTLKAMEQIKANFTGKTIFVGLDVHKKLAVRRPET